MNGKAIGIGAIAVVTIGAIVAAEEIIRRKLIKKTDEVYDEIIDDINRGNEELAAMYNDTVKMNQELDEQIKTTEELIEDLESSFGKIRQQQNDNHHKMEELANEAAELAEAITNMNEED